MTTMFTRIGGWPLVILMDEEGAALAHIAGRSDDIPKSLRTVRVQPDRQISTIASAFEEDVIGWQDSELDEAQQHYQEHAGGMASALMLRVLTGEQVSVAGVTRRHMNECARCGYWHRAMLHRIGKHKTSTNLSPLPATTPAKPGWKTALFYKGNRVRDMEMPYWSDPDPEGQRHLLVHVEAYAPWGEVLCATALASEVMLRPYHEVT